MSHFIVRSEYWIEIGSIISVNWIDFVVLGVMLAIVIRYRHRIS